MQGQRVVSERASERVHVDLVVDVRRACCSAVCSAVGTRIARSPCKDKTRLITRKARALRSLPWPSLWPSTAVLDRRTKLDRAYHQI